MFCHPPLHTFPPAFWLDHLYLRFADQRCDTLLGFFQCVRFQSAGSRLPQGVPRRASQSGTEAWAPVPASQQQQVSSMRPCLGGRGMLLGRYSLDRCVLQVALLTTYPMMSVFWAHQNEARGWSGWNSNQGSRYRTHRFPVPVSTYHLPPYTNTGGWSSKQFSWEYFVETGIEINDRFSFTVIKMKYGRCSTADYRFTYMSLGSTTRYIERIVKNAFPSLHASWRGSFSRFNLSEARFIIYECSTYLAIGKRLELQLDYKILYSKFTSLLLDTLSKFGLKQSTCLNIL
jgi:hypothetical protein